MILTEQWNALSARIDGLTDAAGLFAQFRSVSATDSYGTGQRFGEQCTSIFESMREFRNEFDSSLSARALEVLDQFLEERESLFTGQSGTRDLQRLRAEAALLALATLKTELSFLFSNASEIIRARSERAFAHLQRLIVADSGTRRMWQTAYDEGEIACERLGAAHLLWHGIYAFKINAEGERTDLVFEEPVTVGEQLRYSDGLVLTEWKRSILPDDAEVRFGEARRQAARYAIGALGGLELATHRYAVVVSRDHVGIPADREEGGVRYRHINIAVEPQPPSRAT